MVRPLFVVVAITGAFTLGCSVSDDPRGRFEIVSLTATPAGGAAQTVEDAGTLQFGSILSCDSGWFLEDGPIDACGEDQDGANALSILAYNWVGTGFVPLWSPAPVLFDQPDWDGKADAWAGPIPLGNLSCILHREEQDPLVLTGEGCDGPDGAPFEVELIMDR
jgi:hypothetical protein